MKLHDSPQPVIGEDGLPHTPSIPLEETPEGQTPHTAEIIEETLAEAKASEAAMRMATVLFVFVVVFTGFLSAAYLGTKSAIEASSAAETLSKIEEVLPKSYYNNPLLDDFVVLPPTASLGQNNSSKIYRARQNGQVSAVVVEAIAPDGYAGRIRLILAISAEHKLLGVRIVEHKETPGLGDYIDPRKDKNKSAPWVSQFQNLSLDAMPNSQWSVRKDGGEFSYRVGATVTPRAIVKAVHQAELFVRTEWDLLTAPTSTLKAKP